MAGVDGLPGARVQPGGAAGQVVDEEDAAVPADAVGPVLSQKMLSEGNRRYEKWQQCTEGGLCPASRDLQPTRRSGAVSR